MFEDHRRKEFLQESNPGNKRIPRKNPLASRIKRGKTLSAERLVDCEDNLTEIVNHFLLQRHGETNCSCFVRASIIQLLAGSSPFYSTRLDYRNNNCILYV
ncbi:hypothetical protein CEXT_15321 [Caerostris extrusa]|uniref:Uncharacterized protein n=1 Tax=Caerostris extrusa TaxID=172846 RepID=A0AAV4NBG7_CAEEX|nr:hypothetical protein CEXT_15321 [Caerostris extrusa]